MSIDGGDQLHDDFVGEQWFAAPVLADEGEHAMFDAVPITGAGREMGDGGGQAGLVANFCSSTFQSRTRAPLLPPQSAVISRRLAPFFLDSFPAFSDASRFVYFLTGPKPLTAAPITCSRMPK